MKKSIILAWATLAISLFAIVRDTNAISYNGNTTRDYPILYQDKFEYVRGDFTNLADMTQTDCFVQSLGYGSYPAMCNTSTDGTLKQAVFQTIVEFPFITPDGEFVILNDNFQVSDGGYVGRIVTDTVTNGVHVLTQYLYKNDATLAHTSTFATIDGWDSGGDHPDLIAINFYTMYSQLYTGTNTGIYISSAYDCFYHDSGVARCNEQIYGDISGYSLGYLVATNLTPTGLGRTPALHTSRLESQRFYQSYPISSYAGGQTQLNVLNSFAEVGLSDWYGATSLETDKTTTPVVPPTDYFGDCESLLDVGCFIAGFWNGINDKITTFFDYLFPEISFSGEFNSCGNFEDGDDVGIWQRFANILALINPIPPISGAEICTIYGPKIVEYQAIIPEENLFGMWIPGVLPEVENINLRMAFGQTPIDLIIIFCMMAVVFYQRSKHD